MSVVLATNMGVQEIPRLRRSGRNRKVVFLLSYYTIMAEANLEKTEQKTNVGIMHCDTEQQWFAAQIFARDALSRTWSEDKVLGE